MTDTAIYHPSSSTSPVWAEWLLYAAYAALAVLALWGPLVPQTAHYHEFADQRSLWGLANAADVLSNLPFVLVGVWGLWRAVWQAPAAVRASGALPWLALVFAGLLTTAVGSTYYHLAPSDWRVFWDRMGMVPVFAGVLALAVHSLLGQRAALVTAGLVLLAGPLSLVQWLQTGQLLAWALMQGGGMVLLLVLAFWQWRHAIAVPRIAWPLAAVLGWYTLAKLFELGDHAIWHASQHLLAGHGLKHLAAALALWPLLQKVQRLRNAGHAQPAGAGTMPKALSEG